MMIERVATAYRESTPIGCECQGGGNLCDDPDGTCQDVSKKYAEKSGKERNQRFTKSNCG